VLSHDVIALMQQLLLFAAGAAYSRQHTLGFSSYSCVDELPVYHT